MSEVTGLEEILKNMEDKLGQARVNRISNKALKKQGERNKQIVKKYMASYIDSGKTHDLVISSGVKVIQNELRLAGLQRNVRLSSI